MRVVESEGNVTPRGELPAFLLCVFTPLRDNPEPLVAFSPSPADVHRWCGSAMAERTLLSQSRKGAKKSVTYFPAGSRKDLGKEFPEKLREQSPAQLRAATARKRLFSQPLNTLHSSLKFEIRLFPPVGFHHHLPSCRKDCRRALPLPELDIEFPAGLADLTDPLHHEVGCVAVHHRHDGTITLIVPNREQRVQPCRATRGKQRCEKRYHRQ